MAHCTAALCEGAQAPRLQKHRVLQTSSRLKSCQTMVAVCKRIVSVGALESLSKEMSREGGKLFSEQSPQDSVFGIRKLAFCPG